MYGKKWYEDEDKKQMMREAERTLRAGKGIPDKFN